MITNTQSSFCVAVDAIEAQLTPMLSDVRHHFGVSEIIQCLQVFHTSLSSNLIERHNLSANTLLSYVSVSALVEACDVSVVMMHHHCVPYSDQRYHNIHTIIKQFNLHLLFCRLSRTTSLKSGDCIHTYVTCTPLTHGQRVCRCQRG